MSGGTPVCFDLFGVVVQYDYQGWCRGLAAICEAPEALARMPELADTLDIDAGRQPLRAVHRVLIDELGASPDFARFLAAWSTLGTISIPGMPHLLADVGSSSPLAVLSNIPEGHWDATARAHPETGLFDHRVLSCEIGWAKPEPQFFQTAREALRLGRERPFYVDDLRENVDAAAQAGFDAVLFDGVAELVRALRETGVLA